MEILNMANEMAMSQDEESSQKPEKKRKTKEEITGMYCNFYCALPDTSVFSDFGSEIRFQNCDFNH